MLHGARLARRAQTEEEIARFEEQLSAILEAVGKVAELDLSGVEPTSHPLDLVNVLGEDEPHVSLTQAEASSASRREAHESARSRDGHGTSSSVPCLQGGHAPP